MLYELVGLPGSGKTTFARRISLDHPDEFINVSINSISERIYYLFLFYINNPKVLLFFKKLLDKKENWKLRKYKLHLLYISMAKYQKAKKTGKASAIIDEGLFQRVLTISETVLSQKEIEEVISKLPKDIGIIFFDGGDFYRYKNDSNTKSPRFLLGEKYLNNWKKIITRNASLLRTILKREGVTVESPDSFV